MSTENNFDDESNKLTPKRQDPEIFKALKSLWPDKERLIAEWDVANDALDDFQRNSPNFVKKYIPRIDFAVGPFNRSKDKKYEDITKIETEARKPKVTKLLDLAEERSNSLQANENPRCLLAIEVESSTGRKHRMGSMLNASFIGYFGIVVAKQSKKESEEEVYRSLMSIGSYIETVRMLFW